jgi:hypothetical protein
MIIFITFCQVRVIVQMLCKMDCLYTHFIFNAAARAVIVRKLVTLSLCG